MSSLVKAGPLDVSVEAGYVEPPATEFVAARRRGREAGGPRLRATRNHPHAVDATGYREVNT